MDEHLALLVLGGFGLSTFVHAVYNWSNDRYTLLKNARSYLSADELRHDVESAIASGNPLKAVAVVGEVKIVSAKLSSRYSPHQEGVVCTGSITEHRHKWCPALKTWKEGVNQVYSWCNGVPFSVHPDPRSTSSVLVPDVSGAQLIGLTLTHSHFVPTVDMSAGPVWKDTQSYSLGLLETEHMLLAGSNVTVLGFPTLSGQQLSLVRTDDGPLIITTNGLAGLMQERRLEGLVLKALWIGLVGGSIGILAYLIGKRLLSRWRQHRPQRSRIWPLVSVFLS